MTKIKRLAVLLNGSFIGNLDENADGKHMFTYNLNSESAAELSLSMPRRSAPWTGEPIEAFIDGILPDNPSVRRRIARKFAVNANNPFSLLTAIGLDCGGAVQFVPEANIGNITQEEQVRPITDDEIGERLSEISGEQQASWQIRGEHWSLNGAQDKIALRRIDGQWFEALGSSATTHIIKPGIHELREEGFNEFVCMNMLKNLSIPAAYSEFMVFGGIPAIVSSRWDRKIYQSASGTRVERIHQEDLCQAMGIRPDRKYQSELGPGAVDIIRFLRSNNFEETDISMFLMALVINFLIAGTDAHAKNYAIIEPTDSNPQLAPLYDVASAFAYSSRKNERTLAMSIGGEYHYDLIELHNWQKLAQSLGNVDWQTIQLLLLDLATRVPQAFSDAAENSLAISARLPKTTPEQQNDRTQLVDTVQQGIGQQCERVLRWFM